MHITDIDLTHPFFSLKTEIHKIIKPLLQYIPINFFIYERYYYNGEYIALSDNLESAHRIYQENLMPTLEEVQSNNSPIVFLSPAIEFPRATKIPEKVQRNVQIASEADIFHRILLIKNQPTYVEAFAFGLGNTQTPLEIFLNALKKLEFFCIYFQESHQNILAMIGKNPIIFDDQNESYLSKNCILETRESYLEYLKSFKLNKFPFKGRQGNCYLSMRELECLIWVSKNKTAKQMARILNISYRTIEDYLQNLKCKLGCQSKEQLIDISFNNPIVRFFADQ